MAAVDLHPKRAHTSRLQPERDGCGGFDEQYPQAERRPVRQSLPDSSLVTRPNSHIHSICSNNGAGNRAQYAESAITSRGNSEIDSSEILVEHTT